MFYQPSTTLHIDMTILLSEAVHSHQKQPPAVFCKKVVLRNFAKFTGKHLCQSLFLIKLQARPTEHLPTTASTEYLVIEYLIF